MRVINAFLGLLTPGTRRRFVNRAPEMRSLLDLVAEDHPMGARCRCCWHTSSNSAPNAITIAYAKDLTNTRSLVHAASPGYVATPPAPTSPWRL